MYSICFTIAGVIFSILLFILYSFKTNFSISENKIYHSIIITTIITGLIEIYSFILVKNNIAVDSSLYLYTLKLLFLGFVIWLYSFTLYTVIVTLKLKDKDNDKYRMILIMSSIVFTILILLGCIFIDKIIEKIFEFFGMEKLKYNVNRLYTKHIDSKEQVDA